MATLEKLRIKVFADGADVAGIAALATNPLIKGFTTNPTLMRKAGVVDYEAFAHQVIPLAGRRPISFEVFSDEFEEMERQALRISEWGDNVNVKIPVTNTAGQSAVKLIRRLAADGIRLNVTALMSLPQVRTIAEALEGGPPAIVSVFAGRAADTGRDPVPLMAAAMELVRPFPNIELLWASPRELLNIIQADGIGCHIITVTHDLLAKLGGLDRDLEEFSLDTVKMFHRDAVAAGYEL